MRDAGCQLILGGTCPTSVFHLQHVHASRTDLLFFLCHCLTLVDVTSISSLFAFTFLHPLSILPYDLTPFCARSGATAWETQSSSCFDKCHLGSMVVKSLHKHSCGQENANRSMVCWSMSLFAPCAWMLPKRVPAANWQWFLHLSCPGVRAEELVGWKSWIIMPISGKTAGNSGCDFWSQILVRPFDIRYQCKAQRQHWCWESNWREQ